MTTVLTTMKISSNGVTIALASAENAIIPAL